MGTSEREPLTPTLAFVQYATQSGSRCWDWPIDDDDARNTVLQWDATGCTLTTDHPEHEVALVEVNGYYRVHAPDCRDITRDENLEGNEADYLHVRDLHDLVLATYGPRRGSYMVDDDQTILNWDRYTHNFEIKPCTNHLPHNIPTISDDDRAIRYGDDRNTFT